MIRQGRKRVRAPLLHVVLVVGAVGVDVHVQLGAGDALVQTEHVSSGSLEVTRGWAKE